MIRLCVGQPVRGEDFFGRDEELSAIWQYLVRDNILLLAPRRVGKTSLMFSLKEEAPNRGFRALYCSVSDVGDEAAFAKRLYESLSKEASGFTATLRRTVGRPFLGRMKRVELLNSSVEIDASAAARWSSLGEALVRLLRKQPGQWLLLLDEIPVFVLTLLRLDPSGERARQFLNWLRQLRQNPEICHRVRWLLAGSIGLDTVTARLNLGDTINDLRIVNIGPFPREVADKFLFELGRSYQLPVAPEVRARILDRVGWPIPHHLQIIFAGIRDHCGDHGNHPSLAAVDAAFEDALSSAKRSYFDPWRQRLESELGKPDSSYALAILSTIAVDPAGAARQSIRQVLRQINNVSERDMKMRFLLDVLVRDGYIVESGDRFIFRSMLLREFWLQRVVHDRT